MTGVSGAGNSRGGVGSSTTIAPDGAVPDTCPYRPASPGVPGGAACSAGDCAALIGDVFEHPAIAKAVTAAAANMTVRTPAIVCDLHNGRALKYRSTVVHARRTHHPTGDHFNHGNYDADCEAFIERG
jgi:hypothetical protein